jgi:hypothetical protein
MWKHFHERVGTVCWTFDYCELYIVVGQGVGFIGKGGVLGATSIDFLSAFMEYSVNSFVTSLNDAIDTMYTEIVKKLILGAIGLIDIILGNQVKAESSVKNLLTEVNYICPAYCLHGYF